MSKTIKIIDLLNKIANGEEVPENIKYHNRNLKESDIMLCCKENIIDKLDCNSIYLNDEVEIIEEQEEIDKLEIEDNGFIHTNNGIWKGRKLDIAFAETINKLVEEVKNIKEK